MDALEVNFLPLPLLQLLVIMTHDALKWHGYGIDNPHRHGTARTLNIKSEVLDWIGHIPLSILKYP